MDRGDIVIIELPNGPHFTEVLFKMVDVLTRRQDTPDISVSADFKFVEHITETGWTRFFRPMTVRRFIKQYGNPANAIIDKVYNLCDIKPSTEINAR